MGNIIKYFILKKNLKLKVYFERIMAFLKISIDHYRLFATSWGNPSVVVTRRHLADCKTVMTTIYCIKTLSVSCSYST